MATRTVLTLVLMIFAVVTVAAQGGVGFGPQVGIYKAQDADGVRVMSGAALRIKFSEVLGVEGSINYREEKYGNGFVNVKSWPVMVTGLIYPIPVVYGAIGAGWYNTSIDYNFPSGFLEVQPLWQVRQNKNSDGISVEVWSCRWVQLQNSLAISDTFS